MYMDGRFGNDGGNFFIDPKFADKVKNTRYVVYGDTDSFFGPSEMSFNSKKEAEKFMAEYKAENNID